jgi:hypothetical protein
VPIKVHARDSVGGSLEAHVVKASKACTFDVVNMVIRDEKLFLPSHIHKVFVLWIVYKSILVEDRNILLKGRESFLHEREKTSKFSAQT